MLASTLLGLTLAAMTAAKPALRKKPVVAPAKTDSASVEPDSLFVKVTVAPGQTLSWLGLRHLGGWTPEIASQVASDNPGLHPILQPGQTVRLRRSLDRRNLPPAQQIAMASRKAVVTRLAGPVFRLRPDGSRSPLAADQFLEAGDLVQTGDQAMAELIIDNQSILRVRANSLLRLVRIQDSSLHAPKSQTQVALSAGRVWTKVRQWAGPLVGFEVRMPRSIAGVHGTIFECAVAPDSSSRVWVDEGIVGVRGLGKDSTEKPVAKGQSAATSPSGEVKSETAPNGSAPGDEPASDPNAQATLPPPDLATLLPDPSPEVRQERAEVLKSNLERIVAAREEASKYRKTPDQNPQAPRKQNP